MISKGYWSYDEVGNRQWVQLVPRPDMGALEHRPKHGAPVYEPVVNMPPPRFPAEHKEDLQ